MKDLTVGDRVQWSSQSRGYTSHKKGIVIAVVAAGDRPKPPKGMRVPPLGFGFRRKHTSYLVAVGNCAYWPRVKHLALDLTD